MAPESYCGKLFGVQILQAENEKNNFKLIRKRIYSCRKMYDKADVVFLEM